MQQCICDELPESRRPCKPCNEAAFARLQAECADNEARGLKAWQREDYSERLSMVRAEQDVKRQNGTLYDGFHRHAREDGHGIKIGGKADGVAPPGGIIEADGSVTREPDRAIERVHRISGRHRATG